MKIKTLLPLLFLCVWPQILRADFGSHFIQSSSLSTDLTDPSLKISIRFTCRQDMNLLAVSYYCRLAQGSPSLRVSLRADKDGLPAEDELDSNRMVPLGPGWNTLPMNNLPLSRGTVYHLVLQPDPFRGGHHPVGSIDRDHFASIAYGDHLNPFDPQDETPDPKLNVLVFNGKKWKVLGRQPFYALLGAGDKIQGAPYDSAGERPIHGNGTPDNPADDLLQSECLHPHYGMNATGVMVRVRKQGHPSSPLNYQVYVNQFLQHKTILAFQGKAFDPDQVGKDFQWLSFTFKKEDKPQSFPPECRYIVFQTDSGKASPQAPGCEDCYVLSDLGNSPGLAYGEDLTFDGGAHLSRAAFSTNGGKDWIDEFNRDANVILLGPENIFPSVPPPDPIPTPLPLGRGWAP